MTAPDSLGRPAPLGDAGVPAAELVATTRREGARTAMATVAALRDRGVPVRDIAVVARDLDAYEAQIYRAAIQYGLAPAFWTQLRVTRTRPFALVDALCAVLETDEPTRETLCRPLEHRWCPPSASPAWPIEPETVQRATAALPEGGRTLAAWRDVVASTPAVDDRIGTYVDWVADCPPPTPRAVTDVLGGAVERYADRGLPKTKVRDAPALLDTERDARAVERVRTLVGQLRGKYADRLEEGTVERSWDAVAELARLIATQRPGRREHSNARAVDVLEANDVWLLDVPYVVAVGLVDGEWPRRTDSALPPELRAAVLSGEDCGTLAPRTAWTDGRDRDQFADTLRAAGRGLVVTRHTKTEGGEERRPSPLLDRLDATTVPDDERRRLVGPDRALPDAVRAMLDGQEDAGDE